MGYTHYWTFKSAPRGAADKTEIAYQTAIAECAKIARIYNAECKKELREYDRLSGFSAHTAPNKYGGLEINGKGDQAHEPFTMREHYRQNLEVDAFNFCKTALKPYDVVVTACLAVLKHRLGDLIEVSSDGRAIDWSDGVQLARRITKLKVKNPIIPEPEIIPVSLLKINGVPCIPLTELQNLIELNAKGFAKGTTERATLEVFGDKIRGLL
jgi:hypothetical protein